MTLKHPKASCSLVWQRTLFLMGMVSQSYITWKWGLLAAKLIEYQPMLDTMIYQFDLQIKSSFHSTIVSHDVWSKSWNYVSTVTSNWLVQPLDVELLIICHFRASIWNSVSCLIIATSLSWPMVEKAFPSTVSQFCPLFRSHINQCYLLSASTYHIAQSWK